MTSLLIHGVLESFDGFVHVQGGPLTPWFALRTNPNVLWLFKKDMCKHILSLVLVSEITLRQPEAESFQAAGLTLADELALRRAEYVIQKCWLHVVE